MAERPNFTKKTPFDALRLLAKEQYAHYDPFVCMPFINALKDHLIGSQIKLMDGRSGKVIFFPKDYSSLPVLKLDDENDTEFDLNKNADNLIVEYGISGD
jgi:HD-GYP domain-containing protein (c-di-GMP phosphodiesterase class II)